MNVQKWLEEIRTSPVKKPMPILSFPSVQLLGCTVQELVNDSSLQAKGMKAVADRTNACAAVSMAESTDARVTSMSRFFHAMGISSGVWAAVFLK